MSNVKPTVAVLGLGNWGTALANHLATKGINVVGWSREVEIVEGINSRHVNPHYVSHVTLSQKLTATVSLDEALECATFVLAFPASALGEIIPHLARNKNALLISGIKGLEKTTVSTPLQFAERHLPPTMRLSVLSGPTFAKDLVVQRPMGLVAAAADEATARTVAELFSCDWMKVYVSMDPLGVELGGITKNVIALATGVSDGLGLGDSARAGIITRGLAEMMRLAVALGAEEKTLFGLSGLGDLTMTASCDASRNRTVGVRLGKGESLSEIIRTLGSVAESVSSTPLVLRLAQSVGVEMPITEQVSKLIVGEVSPVEMVRALVTRPLKREF